MILILARDDSMHNFSVQLFQQGRHRAERLLWLLLPSGPKSQRSPHSLLVFPRPIVQYSSYCFIISPLHLPSTSPLYISPLHLPSTSPCINPFSLSPCPPFHVNVCVNAWRFGTFGPIHLLGEFRSSFTVTPAVMTAERCKGWKEDTEITQVM